jgi:hypothetical protein
MQTFYTSTDPNTNTYHDTSKTPRTLPSHRNKNNLNQGEFYFTSEDDFEELEPIRKNSQSKLIKGEVKFQEEANKLLYRENDDYILNQSKEIIQMLTPKFEKIKRKELDLENMAKKAKNYINEYKQSTDLLKVTIDKYNHKKQKLKKFAEALNKLRKDLLQREEDLIIREKKISNAENLLLNNFSEFENEKKKFSDYVVNKSNEIISKADQTSYKLKDLTKLQNLLQSREEQLTEKTKFLQNYEKELKNSCNKFESERYDFQIKFKDYQLQKEEFELYSSDIINKYNEMKIIQKEVENNQNILKSLENEISNKECALKEINDRNLNTESILNKRAEELEERSKLILEKEKEVNQLRLDLELRLEETSKKLEDNMKLNQTLKDREQVLKIKQNIDKDLDLKLSGLELNEVMNRKKIAIQQRLLNEEIQKKSHGQGQAKSLFNNSYYYK